jgi:hypothetical protein
VGRAPQGVPLVLWGVRVDYMKTYLLLIKCGCKVKYIYLDKHFARLKYCTYRLVPVLASNYKQHILSPAKVRKVCFSLAELCVKCVYLNLFGWRGATFMKHFKGGRKL